MKLKTILLLGLLLLLLCPAARGAEPAGYLFRLRPDAAADLTDRAETIYAPEGVYRTEDLALIRELETRDALEYWEEDAPMELFGYEEDYSRLANENWCRAMLGAAYADRQGITGESVRIGVIDSGLKADFANYTSATLITGVNYLVEKSDPRRNDTTDGYSHGTFVTSLICAEAVGFAPSVEIVPLKCFDMSGGEISDLVEALYDAVNVYHCKVINMSLGTKAEYQSLKNAVEYARSSGVILVAAAGNLVSGKVSSGNDPLFYPASYDGVISVGSVDAAKRVAGHSSQNPAVWVTAPGQAVLGLHYRNGSYYSSNGTSFATPIVTAAAALALSADPDLTAEGFADLLARTAEDLGPPGRDNAYGYGLMNLGLLLAALTEDDETFIPSWYDGSLCLSVYRPAREGELNWLARYRADGRFFDLAALTGDGLNNAPVSGEVPTLKLMSLDETTLAPLRGAASYGEEEEADPPPAEEENL